MLELNSSTASYGILIPQSYNEVTSEMLEAYVKDVKLQKHYSIIAICRKTRLFDLAMLNEKANRPVISTKAFLVKFNADEIGFVDAKIKDTVIVTRSSLDLSTHLSTACPLNEETIVKYMRDKSNGDDIIKKAAKGDLKGDNGNDEIVLVSYKIIGNNNIAAIISKDAVPFNPLKITEPKTRLQPESKTCSE